MTTATATIAKTFFRRGGGYPSRLSPGLAGALKRLHTEALPPGVVFGMPLLCQREVSPGARIATVEPLNEVVVNKNRQAGPQIKPILQNSLSEPPLPKPSVRHAWVSCAAATLCEVWSVVRRASACVYNYVCICI